MNYFLYNYFFTSHMNKLLLSCLCIFVFEAVYAEKGVFTGDLLEAPYILEPLKEEECRIFLIRHGETEWNVLGLSQGWEDIPLNEFGIAQAEKIAYTLSFIPISRIYTSVLSRAKETALIIHSQQSECDVIYDSALRFYEKSEEIFATKEERKAAMALEIKTNGIRYLRQVSSDHHGENVVLLTHGKVIKHLMHGINPEIQKRVKVKIGNTGVVRVLVTREDLKVESPY